MTQWPLNRIAGFVLAAGWKGDDAVTATALAYETSGGYDTLTLDKLSSGINARGLFGIDPGDVTEGTAKTLYDPGANAKTAHAFYTAEGGSSDWSPWFAPGAWRQWIDQATAAVQSPSTKSAAPLPGDRVSSFAGRVPVDVSPTGAHDTALGVLRQVQSDI